MKNHFLSRRAVTRSAVTAVAIAATLPLVTHGVASADTSTRLPAQTVTKKLADGSSITIARTNESARINPSMGGTPLHRNAWVSGRYTLSASDPKAKVGISAGYIVGCQLTLGANSTTDGTATAKSYQDISPETATVTAKTGAGVTLGPGQAANYYITDVEYKDAFGGKANTTSVSFPGSKGRLAYTNETMMINGCAGFAQARSYAKVQVTTESASQIVDVYGKPFSIG
ncbi:MspA family porin [Gordonia soli]|uniref:MspA family protein n=1 Tax=Gordonia soli NBRC 108243 TaxID=1223545 RepID=M0QRF4_9ACTN|nr:MspA family porin [Gordonia soli]GAC70891.1 hypothetical protein GS4_43_00170 [Gordonia soli NBRC 108243]